MTAVTLSLAACAGMHAYRDGNALLAEGKFESGLAKLEEATRLEPKNAEYRIAFANRKLSIINGLNARGEAARQQGNLTEAEKAYSQNLAIDRSTPLPLHHEISPSAACGRGRYLLIFAERTKVFSRLSKDE